MYSLHYLHMGLKKGDVALEHSVLQLNHLGRICMSFCLLRFWPSLSPWCLYSIDSCLNLIQTNGFLTWLTFRTSHTWMIWIGMQFCRRGLFQVLFLMWVNPKKSVITLIQCTLLCVSSLHVVIVISVVKESKYWFYRWGKCDAHRVSWSLKITQLIRAQAGVLDPNHFMCSVFTGRKY
jgi:hypothetical protein